VNFIEKSELSELDKVQTCQLWNNEYPEKLTFSSHDDFEEYLTKLSALSHILMLDNSGNIRGWYFDFIRENKKWFVVILDSNIHGLGYGTTILNEAKKKESELNGWVIDHNTDRKRNGEIYKSPLGFYMQNGFIKLSECRMELDVISAVRIKWVKAGKGYSR